MPAFVWLAIIISIAAQTQGCQERDEKQNHRKREKDNLAEVLNWMMIKRIIMWSFQIETLQKFGMITRVLL